MVVKVVELTGMVWISGMIRGDVEVRMMSWMAAVRYNSEL